MKPKVRLVVTALALVFALLGTLRFLSAGGVAYATALSPVYTSTVVQNLDANFQMNAKVTYYNASGQVVLTTPFTLSPLMSLTFTQPSQTGLPTNYAGPAVVDSDKPFGTVVMEYNGTTTSRGKNFFLDCYNGQPTTHAATIVWLPQVIRNYTDGQTGFLANSTIAIQNSSTSNAAIVVITYTQNTGQVYVHSNIAILAGGSYTVDTSTDSALVNAGAFVGQAQISASQPVSVVSHNSETGLLREFSGVTNADAATTLYDPQLIKGIFNSRTGTYQSSAVIAASMDGNPVTATLTYQDNTTPNALVYTDTVANSTMPAFDLRFSPALSGLSSFYGSGWLSSDRPIVAFHAFITTYNSSTGIRAAGYDLSPVPGGATKVLFPLLEKSATNSAMGGTWSSAISGRLAGGSATTVILTLHLSDGTSLQRSAGITPSAPLFSFDQRFDTGLADGTVATGVLTTSPIQPIVAAANIMGDTGVLGDSSCSYQGVAQ